MMKIRQRTIRGMKTEYGLEKQSGEYIISAFCLREREEVRFPDSDEEADRMFKFIVTGGALPGTIKYVLEDYCIKESILEFSLDKKCCI